MPLKSEQQDFFGRDDNPSESLPGQGEYTLERIRARSPELLAVILELLARSIPIKKIAEITHTSVHTVMACRDQESSTSAIATIKERISNQLSGVADLASGALLERLALVDNKDLAKMKDLKDLAVAMGITIDKALLLAGEATSRVDIRISPASHEDFNSFIREESMDLQAEKPQEKGADGCAGSEFRENASGKVDQTGERAEIPIKTGVSEAR